MGVQIAAETHCAILGHSVQLLRLHYPLCDDTQYQKTLYMHINNTSRQA